MRVQAWLCRIFDPPVTQRHFDRAMAEQTEVIREGNAEVLAAVEAGNVKVLAAVQDCHAEILALVSEMKRGGSDVAGDIRARNEARSSDAVGSAPPEDDPD